jgi:hypothetical protein
MRDGFLQMHESRCHKRQFAVREQVPLLLEPVAVELAVQLVLAVQPVQFVSLWKPFKERELMIGQCIASTIGSSTN